MKSPSQQKIIQIDITNACFNKCSNCTRFCGNHKKPFMMDFLTFKKACESLYKYKGMVGIMGGEPTLHPEFRKFVEYYENVFPRKTPQPVTGNPIEEHEFLGHREKHWSVVNGRKRGLWTSLGQGYAKHYDLIRRVFEYQCVNDHKNAGKHQALMITRKELGIDDEKFYKLRDACWIQNLWSATITPKGAFFCEVAGALDMLLNGPGGWEITRDWWQRSPSDFGDQLKWCEICSACLAVPEIESHHNTDIVSPEWNDRLNKIGSTKKRTVFDCSNYSESKYKINKDYTPYLIEKDESTRVNRDTLKCLSVNKITLVTVCVDQSDILEKTIQYNRREFDNIIVVTEFEDEKTIRVAELAGAYIVLSKKKNMNGSIFNKGAMINDGIAYSQSLDMGKWIVLSDADCIIQIECSGRKKHCEFGFGDYIRKQILNPGFLYYGKRYNTYGERFIAGELLDVIPVRPAHDPGGDCYPYGYFQLFNIDSIAFFHRKKDNWYSEEYYSAGHVDNEFYKLYPESRWFKLPVDIAHIYHGNLSENWHGVNS